VDVPACSSTTYHQGWQKAQESTGSSASGIHFGHYIAGTFNLEILVINATLADIPLQTGFTYDHWKKGLNIMIEKMAGDFNIEKLCIILRAALCLNDANSCYDHITLLAATLCLCCLGGSLPMVQSMVTMLHEMQHHIRTTYGDSLVLASRTTWQAPIAGIGQGNGAGPQIWAAVSLPMLDLM